jgi:hypothetical protein
MMAYAVKRINLAHASDVLKALFLASTRVIIPSSFVLSSLK